MRYGLAITKSIRSIVVFCMAVGLTFYLSHAVLHYLFGRMSAAQSWTLTALVFTVSAPILAIFIIHWKGRLREVNSIWLLLLTTISTIALFILWDFIVSNMNRTP